MTRKGRRLTLIGAALAVMAAATALILFALRGNIELFKSPSEIMAARIEPGTRLRIGGLVKEGTIERSPGKVVFVITDNAGDIEVTCEGVCDASLPDLFKQGQGAVVEGVLVAPGAFRADQVLAKHDETYMPRDVAEALKKKGLWRASGSSTAAKAEQAEGAAR